MVTVEQKEYTEVLADEGRKIIIFNVFVLTTFICERLRIEAFIIKHMK